MKIGNVKPYYSVVVPIYNEEERLARFIQELKTALKTEPYELILVNDGSTDRTAEIIKQLDKDKTTCFFHERNRGYGAALKTGISKAQGDIVVIIDADGTYPKEEIPRLVEALDENYVMVVGARTGNNVSIPLIRRPAKFVLNKLANYLSHTKIPDLNSGLRVIRKEVVERFLNILPNNFSFTTTITLAALTNNMNVRFVPINYYKRDGKSKIRPIRDTLNFVQLIIRTVLYFEPLRVFIPLSVGLFVFGILIYIYGEFFLTGSLEVTSSTAISTSVMVLTVGMLADLIDKKLR